MRRTRNLLVVAAIVAPLLALGASSSIAAVSATPVWPAAAALTLPPDAVTGSGQVAAGLVGVACTSPGNCVAVGAYSPSAGHSLAMVAAESAGTWGAGTAVSLPANASTTPGSGLGGVACTSAGNCVAGGEYFVSSTPYGDQGLIVTESGGVWGQGVAVDLPSDAAATNQNAQINGVACTSAGNCLAVGQYVDTGGSQQAMVVTETAGVWGQAQTVQLPGDAVTTPGSQHAYLASVACTAAGSCVAGGEYTDTSAIGPGMLVTETNGVWGQASRLALPTNANTTAGQAYSEIYGVACPSAGGCVGVGYYIDTSENSEPIVASQTAGTWGAASELALPSGAVTSLQNAGLYSVSCPSAGTCIAGGSYNDSGGGEPMVADQVAGTWQPATELALPADATTTAASRQGYIEGVSCTSGTVCTGVGGYSTTTGAYAAFDLTSVSPLAVTASALPAAYVGSRYAGHLAASGGTSRYTWSISAGSLPRGLRLNGATGAISGTPKAAGTVHFTVKASDAGPPAQTATGSVSIVVRALPNTKLLKSTIGSSTGSASFKFKATGYATGLQCALIASTPGKHAKATKPHFKRCKSPKSYKHLKTGSYTFYVRAISPGGADKTPAKHKFQIA